jgi:N-acetylneuraminic acid mutarotase
MSQQPSSTNSNSSWMIGTSLPTARSEIAGVELDAKIYVIGGFDNSGSSSDSVEVYDVIDDRWTTGEPLPQPLDHTAVASFDGKLYVVGGGYLNKADLSDKLFIYDPSTKNWVEGANLPTPRGALTANFVNGIFDEPNAS